MKIDPYKHQEKFLKWKENNKNGIEGISKENSDIILQYLSDMERGVNIANGSIKGGRSYSRLESLKNRLVFFSYKFKELFKVDNIININEDQLMTFFSSMRTGEIKRQDG